MLLRPLCIATLVTLGSCVGGQPHRALAADGEGNGPPITVTHPVAFEAPYKLGERPVLRSKDAADAEQAEITRWNTGGRAAPWHPAARVVVDAVHVSGRISDRSVLAVARRDGYWPIRRCYEAGLAQAPELKGKVRVRFTIRHTGTAVRPTFEGTPDIESRAVADCIRSSFRSIRFPRTRKGDATARLSIALYPGDAPVRPAEEPPVTPGPGALDMPVVQALVAAQAGAQAQRCYVDGATRMPGLWGRLLLRADVASNGTVRELVEVESTFPDPVMAECVRNAVTRVTLPPPRGGDVRVVIPIRFGPPAT